VDASQAVQEQFAPVVADTIQKKHVQSIQTTIDLLVLLQFHVWVQDPLDGADDDGQYQAEAPKARVAVENAFEVHMAVENENVGRLRL
jgi:hypothetical protein